MKRDMVNYKGNISLIFKEEGEGEKKEEKAGLESTGIAGHG